MANNMVSYWCGTVFDNFKGSVVRLDCAQQFRGNGFVVVTMSNTCLILTCEHVLPKSNGSVVVGSTVSALFHTCVKLDARVSYVNVGRDLALLRIDSMSVSCTPTRLRLWEEEDGDVLTGMDVVLLSFFTTKNDQVFAEPGTFPGKILSEPVWSEETKSEELRLDYTSMAGTSGAPVFLQRVNKVVGVNNGSFGGKIKIASSIRTIKAALREWLQIGNENITIRQMLQRIVNNEVPRALSST